MINLPNGLFEFQEDCINFLLEECQKANSLQTITIKSPTGSGKTVILLGFIDEYLDNLDQNACFIWLCPGDGELEEQSKKKMEKLLPGRQASNVQDILVQGFNLGETVFINWQLVTKQGNRAIIDSERKNLFEMIAKAHRDGIHFIIIIDEEHRNDTAKANDIINAFSAQHIIRVSATAHEVRNETWYEIDETDVINSGLITKALYINQDIENVSDLSIETESNFLIDLADSKRKTIAEKYQKLHKDIRPLVIIQFPSSSDQKIRLVEEKLAAMGYTYQNQMVAIWLDKTKINIDQITDNNASPIFLLMKQAISTGWDCPRAKILIKLRENMNEDFEIQTLGRLRRMPETKHYNDDTLDFCFLYTFDERYKESILAEGNAFEVRKLFLKEKAKSFSLQKQTRDLDFDMIGEKETLIKAAEFFSEKYGFTKNTKLNRGILENNGFIIGTKLHGLFRQGKFIKLEDILLNNVGHEKPITFEVDTHTNGIDTLHIIDEIKRSIGLQTSKTRAILKILFHQNPTNKYKIAKFSNKEWYAFIINNAKKLKSDFVELISQTNKQGYLIMPKLSEFKIPREDYFGFDSNENDVDILISNAYENYDSSMVVEGIRSKCERLFENYCEDKKDIDWIYKNGDKGQQYLSVVYTTGLNKQFLFYPDYIVRKTNGEIWIIEAKGGEINGIDKNIDKQVENKFAAFKEYALKQNIKWGFVRDKSEKLKINFTEYHQSLSHESWIPLKDVF